MSSAAFFQHNAMAELSFALSDANTASLFAGAGFREISIEREICPVVFNSLDEY